MIDQLSVLRLFVTGSHSPDWTFQSFCLHILLFRLTPQGHSQNNTSRHLTDCVCSVCLLIQNPAEEFCPSSDLYSGKQKNKKTSCSSHESDTAVAGSEFRSSKSNPSCCGLPCWYVHCCVTVTCALFPQNYLHDLSDTERSLYLQNRNGLDWI